MVRDGALRFPPRLGQFAVNLVVEVGADILHVPSETCFYRLTQKTRAQCQVLFAIDILDFPVV